MLVTHIHFDHAGAAGWMATRGARIHVHAFGATHLVDPSRLLASATRIYGDRMERLWGTILPCDAALVRPADDGAIVVAGGLRFRAIETPGHARHHHAWALEGFAERIAFTGDAAACFIDEAPEFISIPTPPPEFDPEAWRRSLDRLRSERLDRIYPTHFGAIEGAGDVAAHLDRVEVALAEHEAFVARARAAGTDRDAIRDAYRAWFVAAAVRAGVPEARQGFYVKDSLADMNVDGILRRLDRRDAALTPRPSASSASRPPTGS